MATQITLYMFTGSGPSMTASLMLRHKGVDYRPVHLMVGAHALGLRVRGFPAMTVPALIVDGRRVQGSRRISRALDDLVPHPRLFPTDPERRRAVANAERWGEGLQDAARRLVLWAARRDQRAFLSVYRHPRPTVRPLQRAASPVVVRLASAAHGASDRAAEGDVRALATRLGQVDTWIEQGVLDGAELNAADFQIAPAIALLLCLADLRPFVEGRPAARLARRIVPDCPGRVDPVLPSAWLSSLRTTDQPPETPATYPPGA